MSNTPRTDALFIKEDDNYPLPMWIDDWARQLERELNESNKIIRQQQEENLMLKERIKRLEDVLQTAWFLMANVNWKRKKDPDMYKDFVNWRDNDFLPVMRWQKRKDTKAKEAKP